LLCRRGYCAYGAQLRELFGAELHRMLLDDACAEVMKRLEGPA
jgi:hypothetical protein